SGDSILGEMAMKYRWLIIVSLFAMGILFPTGAQSKTVKDQLGRLLTLPDNPRRVIALAPNITEIIFALGQEHRLKGATRFSDFPPEAATLARVGSYIHLDLEKIVALNPDLCIAIKDGNPKEVVDRLASFNIPVYAVDPRNLETVMETLLEIGKILDADKRAKNLVRDMRSRIQRVRSLVDQTTYRPRVFFQIGISPIVSVGT
ncbi:MAG: ABC transporter substrate-binding protein, partial [bacterium]|nr:ABC transporter substrate-binding protein [bacterium]